MNRREDWAGSNKGASVFVKSPGRDLMPVE
jgi:hypothetical protein